MAKVSSGALSLPAMFRPHSTNLRLDTEVVSVIRDPRLVLREYFASMSISVLRISPLNLIELPSSMEKSLARMPGSTNW